MSLITTTAAHHKIPSKIFNLSKLNLAMRSMLLSNSILLTVSPMTAMAEVRGNQDIQLKEVEVWASAVSDTRTVKGYNAKKKQNGY